jgi:hypothetical protein
MSSRCHQCCTKHDTLIHLRWHVSPIPLSDTMSNTFDTINTYMILASSVVLPVLYLAFSISAPLTISPDSVLRFHVTLLSWRILSYQLEDYFGFSTTIKYPHIVLFIHHRYATCMDLWKINKSITQEFRVTPCGSCNNSHMVYRPRRWHSS